MVSDTNSLNHLGYSDITMAMSPVLQRSLGRIKIRGASEEESKRGSEGLHHATVGE